MDLDPLAVVTDGITSMKQIREYPQLIITRKAARSLSHGHPWVFAGEVVELKDSPLTGMPPTNGDIIDLVEANGTWQGAAFLSQHSTIRARILSRNANDVFDEAFWRRRIAWAWQHRVAVMGSRGKTPRERQMAAIDPKAGLSAVDNERVHDAVTSDLLSCRVIFGESDGFPGLIVDRYGQLLVTQVGTVGMERLRGLLYPLLLEVLRDAGEDLSHIFERCDSSVRDKEGLERRTGWWKCAGTDAALNDQNSPETTITISENGLSYVLDLAKGQKTGFFLDQKYNRLAVKHVAAGRRVLDCFCHVGAFGLNAARGKASYVRCVDASETALNLAQTNARLNGFVVEGADANTTQDSQLSPTVGFTRADVLKYLPRLRRDRSFLSSEGGPFDLIVLDPPAFVKTRSAVQGALRGYRFINEEAMRLLPRGGYLATCSCSQHMTTELLSRAIAEAAHAANVQLKLVEQRQQAPDHPILWGFPQSHYLDFFIFQVV